MFQRFALQRRFGSVVETAVHHSCRWHRLRRRGAAALRPPHSARARERQPFRSPRGTNLTSLAAAEMRGARRTILAVHQIYRGRDWPGCAGGLRLGRQHEPVQPQPRACFLSIPARVRTHLAGYRSARGAAATPRDFASAGFGACDDESSGGSPPEPPSPKENEGTTDQNQPHSPRW